MRAHLTPQAPVGYLPAFVVTKRFNTATIYINLSLNFISLLNVDILNRIEGFCLLEKALAISSI